MLMYANALLYYSGMAQLVTADGGVYEVDTELLVDALDNVDNITFPLTVTVKLSASGKIVSAEATALGPHWKTSLESQSGTFAGAFSASSF